jgi:hypothetical protein
MPTLWVVIGAVVAVLLAAGWLYDRRFGFQADRMPSTDRQAQAEADGRNTHHGATHFGGPF